MYAHLRIHIHHVGKEDKACINTHTHMHIHTHAYMCMVQSIDLQEEERKIETMQSNFGVLRSALGEASTQMKTLQKEVCMHTYIDTCIHACTLRSARR